MPYGTVVGYKESTIDSIGFGIPETIQDLRAVAHADLERGDIVTFMADAVEMDNDDIGAVLKTAEPATFAGPKTVGVVSADVKEGEEVSVRISGLAKFVKTADTSSNKFIKPANGSTAATADATEQVTSIGKVLGAYEAGDSGSYDVQLFGVPRHI